MPEDGHTSLLKKEKKHKYRRRQQEVLDAAAAVIARKGYHGASTTDIAGELGVSQPSLYYYFTSKDEALEEICRIGIAGYLDRLQAIMERTAATHDKIRDAIQAHIEPVLTIPNYVKSFQRERRYLSSRQRRQLTHLAGAYDTLFRVLLETGVGAGDLNPGLDCGLAALMLITQCNAAQYYVVDEDSLIRMSAAIADVFLVGAAR